MVGTVVGGVRGSVGRGGVGLCAPFPDAPAIPIPPKSIFHRREDGASAQTARGRPGKFAGPGRMGILAAAGPGGGITISIERGVCGEPLFWA